MGKRKINDQQQRRIANKQAMLLNTNELSGLVIAHHGQNIEVEDVTTGIIYMCKKRQHLGNIVPGDLVKWQVNTETKNGVVIAIDQRTSLLTRPDSRGNPHALAANVDNMFIIIAPTPSPQQTTIDRYLIAAQQQNVTPILVLNKEDLLSLELTQNNLIELLDIYNKIGIKTLIVSAKKNINIQAIRMEMTNKTSVFVGQSGTGKSSIIAIFLPLANIKTAEAELHAHGCHTTTSARLYHVNDLQANVIDSPGIREFPLWHLNPATLAQEFVEFVPFLNDCKFRNCMHNNEPHCGLLIASHNGNISPTRLASYQKILAGMNQKHN